MSYPHFLTIIGKVFCHLKNIAVRMSRKLPVIRISYMLNIQNEKIRYIAEPFKLFKELSLTLKGISRGIKCCIDSLLLSQFKKLGDEINLKKSFTSAHGYSSTVLPVRSEPHSLLQYLRRRHALHSDSTGIQFLYSFINIFRIASSAHDFPSFGIMAIFAPHITTLQKYDKTYSRTVNRSETLC